LARMKICRIQEIVTVGHAPCCTFINCAINATVRAVINGDDGVCLIQRRVPTCDGTVFTDKNEKGGRRLSILCQLEERCAVEDLPSGISNSSVPRSGGDRYDERNSCAILMVEGRNTGAVVADPNRPRWRDRHAP